MTHYSHKKTTSVIHEMNIFLIETCPKGAVNLFRRSSVAVQESEYKKRNVNTMPLLGSKKVETTYKVLKKNQVTLKHSLYDLFYFSY